MKLMATMLLIGAFTWSDLWFSPDQRGQRLMRDGEFAQAAAAFQDPMRQGIAWFRAGEFKKAEQSFRRLSTPDAIYNRGNCQVMQGKYEAAVETYDRALKRQPDFPAATTNREIAVIRAKRVAQEGGDLGDQQEGADDITFDKKEPGGQETVVQAQQPISSAAMQAMWLRRVQTKPAEFLKAKFAYQDAFAGTQGDSK
ncbi:tetratricopeptide repeat protein [Allorhodopirellula heiligendammensis]|uniref:Tetratricopeptide repeat protein n=1 Tax=Allorhodopirellula heiligendammensis TaxID=2714739 RepID=A0A5C6BGS8_9BACT|nr:tetratricopeptide repeat protein [Allorhodopirellula heiligendammensis]TWU10469.1 Tetratricopeptide repeat protein [Allorhodopirellula heiligendammensis]